MAHLNSSLIAEAVKRIKFVPRKSSSAILEEVADCDFNRMRIFEIEAPIGVSASAILNAANLSSASQIATKTSSSAVSDPDVPRVLSVVGSAATVAGNVVVSGKDIEGNDISDTIALNGTSTVSGVKAFSEVESVVLPTKTGATETVSVGVTKKFGMPEVVTKDGIIFANAGSAIEGTRPTLVADTAISKCTISPNTNPDGAKTFRFVYIA